MARVHMLADVAKALKANIYAIDNLSPVSRVAVYIKAGSRYEPDAVPGISHFLRASAGLTTQDSSIFGITRHLERAGASLKVTNDREYLVYRVDCLRDKLGYVLGFIDDIIHKPEFRSWEIEDVLQPRVKQELLTFKANQELVANEALHKVAYRGGLAHSVFAPEHQIKTIKKNHLFEFVENNIVLERMSFFATGVDENELRSNIEERFRLNPSPFKGVDGASRYVGGEARIQANFAHTLVKFVVQGSPITDLKSIATLDIIGFVLGSQGKGIPPLLKSYSPHFNSSIINLNHTDTGLFGFQIRGPNELLKNATKAVVSHVRQVMNNLNEEDLKTAKRAAKTRALILSENQNTVFSTLGRRHAAGIVSQGPLDYTDKLTLKDVRATVENLLKSKPTIVSVGNPRYVPYVDEIDS